MSVPRMLEVHPDPPYKRYVKYGVVILVIVLFVAGTIWYLFRFHAEEGTVDGFLDTVIAGHYQQAFHVWSAGASYDYDDFLEDWGPKGYYGPVRSYQIVGAHQPKDGSGVIIVVDVSPFRPFPENDFEKDRQTKQVRLWVQLRDHTLSYAP